MMLKKMRNHAGGKEIRDIINYNFNVISKALASNGCLKYTQDISVNDWINNSISIPFTKHGIEAPNVQLFVKDEDSFDVVIGGVKIDSEHNVTLSTDLSFDGRVVIE